MAHPISILKQKPPKNIPTTAINFSDLRQRHKEKGRHERRKGGENTTAKLHPLGPQDPRPQQLEPTTRPFCWFGMPGVWVCGWLTG